jgi:RNA polymerase sigma-B factor
VDAVFGPADRLIKAEAKVGDKTVDKPWIRVRPAGDGRQLVALKGTLDFGACVRLRLLLYDGLDGGCRTMFVDLSKAGVVDASAVRMLVRVNKHLCQQGGCLRMVGVSGSVRAAIEQGGGGEILGTEEPPHPVSTAEDNGGPHPDGWRNAWGFEVIETLHEMYQLPAGDPRRAELRSRAIEIGLPHACRLARRFRGLGEPLRDLNQVAALGLVKAVDGFDPQVGVDFGAYATPTIVGELKRYFRDHGWSVRVPRRLQELVLEIKHSNPGLTQQLARYPSVTDTARDVGVSEEQVTLATIAANAYRPLSLFRPIGRYDGPLPIDQLGASDSEYDAVEMRASIGPALEQLTFREKKIIAMRFYGNMSQAQIAAELGISQMHVSRLLRGVVDRLRSMLLSEC